MISEEQYEHLIKLLEENNEMLKKVVSFVDTRNDPDYIASQQGLEFANNLASNILYGLMPLEQRKHLENIIKATQKQ